ncbi:MAG: methylated-DNA--[protein]-cysteine S-methyltransferase [Deltaproteobacteria bacterium]|nr:methylated-DNA--[protein]-cysteine S-methyltransferase [Deltaproteobacteria bacterium]
MSKEKLRDGRYTRPVRLPYGWASAVLDGGRLISVAWEEDRERLLSTVAGTYPGATAAGPEETGPEAFLREYAEGKTVSIRDIAALPIAWEKAHGFDRAVLRETARVPYGSTVTYGELAARAGSPGAARAAGAALARNPWPVIIPCHRVVGVGGNLVGFGKGLAAKDALIRFEERRLSP